MAALFIMFFSIIGIYGNMLATCVEAGACPNSDLGDLNPNFTRLKQGIPADVAKTMGLGIFSVVNIIMMTTSMSTVVRSRRELGKL